MQSISYTFKVYVSQICCDKKSSFHIILYFSAASLFFVKPDAYRQWALDKCVSGFSKYIVSSTNVGVVCEYVFTPRALITSYVKGIRNNRIW